VSDVSEFSIAVEESPSAHFYFDKSASGVLFQFSVVLLGAWILNPSGSTAATGSLSDGADGSGNPDLPMYLAANGLITPSFGSRGTLFMNGIYLNVTAGEFRGSLTYRRVPQP
jgi:hypothetical protein